jgi:hypothetical protein
LTVIGGKKVHRQFSIFDSLAFGFKATIGNILFLVAVLIALLIIPIGLAWSNILLMVGGLFDPLLFLIYILLSVLFSIITLLIFTGFIKITLKLAKDEKVEFWDLFYTFPLVFKFLIGSVLFGAITSLGSIIPPLGYYLTVKYQFFLHLIADKEVGPIDALMKSAKMTEGVKLKLFITHNVFALILVLMILVFGVFGQVILFGLGFFTTSFDSLWYLGMVLGVLIGIPTITIAFAQIYQTLLGQSGI